MKKYLTASLLSVSLITGSALAAPIYIESTGVEGLATLTYDNSWPMNDAPEFTFDVTAGSLSHNLGAYTPGDYTIDFTLEGFWVDYDEDGTADFTLAPVSVTGLGPASLGPLPPLSGTAGALSWNVDVPGSSVWLSYDFDSVYDRSLFSNFDVNGSLASVDMGFSGSANGVMDARIGWKRMRIDLKPVAVPEPSLWLLSGIGLIGFGVARIRRRRA